MLVIFPSQHLVYSEAVISAPVSESSPLASHFLCYLLIAVRSLCPTLLLGALPASSFTLGLFISSQSALGDMEPPENCSETSLVALKVGVQIPNKAVGASPSSLHLWLGPQPHPGFLTFPSSGSLHMLLECSCSVSRGLHESVSA
jgi:hypothetical protein